PRTRNTRPRLHRARVVLGSPLRTTRAALDRVVQPGPLPRMSRDRPSAAAHPRALKRIAARQIIARARLRTRQACIRLAGLDRVLPRHRRILAPDWKARLHHLRPKERVDVNHAWAESAGLRTYANHGWLAEGAGRPLLHARDLARLELHYQHFLCDGSLGASAWSFLAAYLSDHAARASDTVHEWHPYAASQRLTAWLKFLAAEAPSADSTQARRLARECLRLADYVGWMLERDIEANHLLKNLFSLALCDLLLRSEQAAQASVVAYVDELERQLLGDGGHYELCPMYHARVLLAARELNLLIPPEGEPARRLSDLISRMESWLEILRAGSRAWANINDSWTLPDVARRVWANRPWEALPSLIHLRDSGLVRGNRGRWRGLVAVGSVSPTFNPGHSHSDVLSLILHHDQVPLLVDPGVLHYSPNDERRFLKSCHAHNGPCLRDRDHTELVGSFRVGRAGRAFHVRTRSAEDEHAASAALQGYAGMQIHRTIASRTDEVVIEDSWKSDGARPFAPWARFLWNASLSEIEC